MGSAFPNDGLGSAETVMFLMWADEAHQDIVCHLTHQECQIDYPHRMHECGRFSLRTGAHRMSEPTHCLHPTWKCYPSPRFTHVKDWPRLHYAPMTEPNIKIQLICNHCGRAI